MLLPEWLYLFVVFGALVLPVDAIECYECYGSEDKVCNDPFGKHSYIKPRCVQCAKWKGTYPGIEGPFVTRECLLSEVQAYLTDHRCATQKAYGVKAEVCWCNKNLCNGSETSAVALALVLLAGILAAKNMLMY